jgi:hypothetical protein
MTYFVKKVKSTWTCKFGYLLRSFSMFKVNILKGLSDGLLFFVKRQKVFNHLSFVFCYEHDLFPKSGYNTKTKRFKNYYKSDVFIDNV